MSQSSSSGSTLEAPSLSPEPGRAREAAELDPELQALPAPPKRERSVTVALMLLTALASAWMAYALLGEAKYAVAPGKPVEIGDLAAFQPSAGAANEYVRGEGLLGTTGAIRYGRAAEGDSFRLAPVAGNEKVWIEIRVPEGFEGPRFVPPTSFAGRLVPFQRAGVRHVGLIAAVADQTGKSVPADAWLLIDGSSPRTSRWAVALASLFGLFALWNLGGVARIVATVRDRPEPTPGSRLDRGESAA